MSLVSVDTRTPRSAEHAGHSTVAAASHPGWWLSVGCGLMVLALGLASTTDYALGTARVVEEVATT
jgi:hypothetical protein